MSNDKSKMDRIVAYATALGTVCAFIAIAVSIALANGSIKEMREEAKIQHLLDESNKFEQEPLLTSRKHLAEKRIDRKKQQLLPLDKEDPPGEMFEVLNACDEVGLLTKRGFLDVDDVWNQFGYWFFYLYADSKPAIDFDRKEDSASMANCSWLIEEMRPIEIKNGGANLDPSQDALYGFYANDFEAEPGRLPSRGHKR